MSRSIEKVLPPVEVLIEMEPEEIGPFLLEYLHEQNESPGSGQMNRYNLTHNDNIERYFGREYRYVVAKVITEAWMWLEREGLIAPKPDDTSGSWYFITRRGQKLKNLTDFKKYNFGNILPSDNLDPALLQKAKPAYIRGDNETAILLSFKEVEVRTRTTAKLPDTLIGVALMREAFNPKGGPLTDMNLPEAEREAIAHLFAGAIGMFKNPSSHRYVDYKDSKEVAEIIMFANYLLKVIDSRSV